MKSKSGFTIVELLIVIVVIGILASVTVVAFNGVSNRSVESSVKADMRNNMVKVQQSYVLTGTPNPGNDFMNGGTLPELIWAVSNKSNYVHYTVGSQTNNSIQLCGYGVGGQPPIGFVQTANSKTGKYYANTSQNPAPVDITALVQANSAAINPCQIYMNANGLNLTSALYMTPYIKP